MFVGCVVIDDKVNVQFRREAVIQPPQERQKLLMAVPRLALGKHRAGCDIESRDFFILNAARPPWAEFVVKPGKTPFYEVLPPFSDRCLSSLFDRNT